MRKGICGIAAAGILVILFVGLLCHVSWAADCSEPPFLTSGVESNALVILDSSGSMQEFAYQEASGTWRTTSPVTVLGPTTFPTPSTQCQDLTNCGTYTQRTNCNNCRCVRTIPWTMAGGDSGTCSLTYSCRWSNSRCVRATTATTCTVDNPMYNWSATYNTANETVTITETIGGDSETAHSGFVPTTKYYGYFDPDKTYKYYNTAGKHFFEAVGDVVDPNTGDSTAIRGACTTSPCDRFSGNWLNWLCMRRTDITKKVLTGGRLGSDADNYVLIGSPHETNNVKLFKDNKTNGVYYTPFAGQDLAVVFSTWDWEQRAGNGDKTKGGFVPLMSFFPTTFSSATSATSTSTWTSLGVSSTTNPGEPRTVGGVEKRYYDGSYYFAVKHSAVTDDAPPSGIVQEMAPKLRVGLMRFNWGTGPAEGRSTSGVAKTWDIDKDGIDDEIIHYADGGRILNPVGDRSTVESWQIKAGSPIQILTVTKNINETIPAGNTPLAEVLREAMNYFRQNAPSYSWVDAAGNPREDFHAAKGTLDDPYYFMQAGETTGRLQACAKSYIILVSDGEANNDHPCYPDANCDLIARSFRFNDSTGYLDDIAYQLWTEDNRLDIGNDPGPQTIGVYTIFAFEQSDTSKKYLQSAAIAGGFSNLDGENPPQPGQEYPASCSPCNITGIDPWTSLQRTNCCGWRDSYNYKNWDGWREWDSAKDTKPDHYYEAPDGYLLESQVRAIFAQLALGGAAGAVATISQQTQEGDVIIRGAFDASDVADRTRYVWNGHLEVYWPDSEGGYEFQYSENQGLFCAQMTDHLGDGLNCWDAAKKLKDLSVGDRLNRNIFTYVDGVQTAFTMTNAEIFRGLMRKPVKPTDPDPLLNAGVPELVDVNAIIQWTRGVVNSAGQPSIDGTTAIDTGYRDRKGYVLGDIVYSTPVIVGPPPLGSVSGADTNLVKNISGTNVDYNDGAEAFWAFRNAWLTQVKSDGTTGTKYQGRPKIAYVGANDGMLHAFLIARLCKATDGSCREGEWDYNCTDEGGYGACGKELWAYIPSNLLGELSALAQTDYGMTLTSDTCKHRTMVDLSPRAWDVFIKSPDCAGSPPSDCSDNRCWRTIIIGGERGGGDVYFAVDVTDPLTPKVLWEYSVLKNLPVVYDDSGTLKMNLPFRENDILHDASVTNDSTCDPDNWPDWPDTCFDQMYFGLKTLPMSWSKAVLGRVRMPSDISFWRYLQGSTGTATLSKTSAFTDCSNKRHIAFIGTAFQIFNFADLPSSITNDEIKKALTKPHLLALDVETGQNYYQVLWAMAVNARTNAGTSMTNDIPIFDQHMPLATTANYVPWAFGSPALVDIWDNQDRDAAPDAHAPGGRFAEDGYVDRMYLGDMQGFFYRMAFNFKDYGVDSSSNYKGMNIEYWKTKPIPETETDLTSCDQTNKFRGCRQPISVTPALSYDLSSSSTGYPKIRALFGTGKFDKVTGTTDDKTDETKMSFYNLGDDVAPFCTTVSGKTVCTAVPPIPTAGASYNISVVNPAPTPSTIEKTGTATNGFLMGDTHFGLTFGTGACLNDRDAANKYDHLRICDEHTMPCDDETKTRVCGDDAACRSACTQITGRDACCNWITDSGAADCCQGTCTPKTCDEPTPPTACRPCWDCVYDFAMPGERVIGDPLIAFGLVFFTTYIPTNTPCAAGGQGYLYIMNYRCMPLDSGFNPVTNSFGRTVVHLGESGAKISLDAGMPSEPVMDSSGQFVFVQKSDATVVKIGVPGGGDGGGGGGGSAFKDIQFKGWDKK